MKSWKDGFVAWDTETSGLRESARILEIASVAFVGGSMIGSASSLLNPGLDDEQWAAPDTQQALSVSGIERSACERAPGLATWFTSGAGAMSFGVGTHVSVLDKLFAYDVGVYVAHNARFDLRVLASEAARLLVEQCYAEALLLDRLLTSSHLCTMGLDIALRPDAEGHGLAATCARWRVKHGTLHRALDDAQATGRLLLHMADELPDDLEEVLELQRTGLNLSDERHAARRRT